MYDEVKAELKLRGGYIMSPEECKKASSTIIKDGRLNAGALAALCRVVCGLCCSCLRLAGLLDVKAVWDCGAHAVRSTLLTNTLGLTCFAARCCLCAVQTLSARRPLPWRACLALRCPPTPRC